MAANRLAAWLVHCPSSGWFPSGLIAVIAPLRCRADAINGSLQEPSKSAGARAARLRTWFQEERSAIAGA